MRLFRRRRARRGNTPHDLQEESDVLQTAGLPTLDNPPAEQPTTKAPRKGLRRRIARGARAIVRTICPCCHPKVRKDNAEENISESPSIQDNNIQEDPSIMVNRIPVIPSIEDFNVPSIPSFEDSDISKGSSTEDRDISKSSSSGESFHSAVSDIQSLPPEFCNEITRSSSFHSAVSSQDELSDETDQKESNPISSSTTIQGASPSVPSSSATIQGVSPSDPSSSATIQGASPSDPSSSTTIQGTSPSVPSINTTIQGASPSVPSSNTIDVQPIVMSMENLTFYKILGQGSYGKVLLASHPSIKQKLAVKVVEKKDLLSIGMLYSAFSERDVMRACRDCPYITNLHCTFQAENHLIYIMEFLSGGMLVDMLEKHAPFNLNNLRYVTAELICGLQFLHTRKIIHRDIKPENILLDSVGHIRIADLGLAVSGITKTHRLKDPYGTLHFMAPELLQFKPYYTVADYFSLGVLVYGMALGYHPFYFGQDARDYIESVCTKKPVLPENMDRDLGDLILRLLKKKQGKREVLVRNIRGHAFFKTINWQEVDEGRSPPPFTPTPILEDYLNQRTEVDTFMALDLLIDVMKPDEQKSFNNFTFTSESLKMELMASPPSSTPS